MQQPKILVAIRKRPLSKKQASKGENDIVAIKTGDTVIVSQYKQKVDLTKYLEETLFNFDFAFDQQTQNEEIYDSAVRPLVDSAFQGAKVTCFAYGQTGSGKTYTMNGNISQGVYGLYTLGANDIFEYLQNPQFRHLKARLSFFEIYCGKLFDLLNKRQQLKLREDNKNNINIIGLEEASITSCEQFMNYLALGSQQRVTSMNSANADSSRSHAILQISLKEGKKLFGKISFIDLAGNERGADHMDMDKQTRIDGAEINKSLLSLKECIRALDQGKGHTPFRGSKLTMVLKDSFVGFCRTVMIGNISPSSASSENTLNTLRYADRVKQLRKPQQGGSKQEMKAKEMMLPRQNKNAIRIMIENGDDLEDIARKRDEAEKDYRGMDQSKNVGREQVNSRKNSMAANKIIPVVKDNKSNSLVKNYMGNGLANKPLTNNLVGQQPQQQQNNFTQQTQQPNLMSQQPNLYGKQPAINNQKREGYGEKVQPNIGNRGNNLTGMGVKKQQSMQIESPYYVPINNKSFGDRQTVINHRPSYQQQPQSISFQPIMSARTTEHYSNATSLPQNTSNSNYNDFNNPHLRRSQVSNTYVNSIGNSNVSNNLTQSNYQPYNQNYQQSNNQNNFQPYNQNYQQNNNTGSNFQPLFRQEQQRHQTYPKLNQQPVHSVPENWQDLVNIVSQSGDPDLNGQLLTQMNKRLFRQQQDLTRNHGETIRRQINIIKSEMSMLNEIEIDRSKTTSRGYVQFVAENIDEKISNLEMLRERLISFTYKLDQMEEIENSRGGKTGNDDEQLLDDIN